MKTLLMYVFVLLSLMGCSPTNDKVEHVNEQPTATSNARLEKLMISNESKQVDDFKVSIRVDENLNASASITYVGDEAEKNIYHGGNIFFFNIYQLDGDFMHEGFMHLPLITTTLIQHEPHIVYFDWLEDLALEDGLYKFEAIASFSFDSANVQRTGIRIPVSTNQIIES